VIDTLKEWGERHQQRLSCSAAPDADATPSQAA
jgi:hypothetical protein